MSGLVVCVRFEYKSADDRLLLSEVYCRLIYFMYRIDRSFCCSLYYSDRWYRQSYAVIVASIVITHGTLCPFSLPHSLLSLLHSMEVFGLVRGYEMYLRETNNACMSNVSRIRAGVVGSDLSPVLTLCLSDSSLEVVAGFLINVRVSVPLASLSSRL